jgi:hypothetical protein
MAAMTAVITLKLEDLHFQIGGRPEDRAVQAFPSNLIALSPACVRFFMRPGRLIRSAIVLKPSTLLNLHRASAGTS